MTSFRAQAQLRVLAQTLGVGVDDVEFLGSHSAEFIHDLRWSISAHLFDRQAHVFSRVSTLAPLVPNSLVAKLVPRMVPAVISGRAAGALALDHQDRIPDMLERLPADYMAKCAPHLDPRVIETVAPLVSAEALVPAAQALLACGDYVTAAGFVEAGTPELIDGLMKGLDDDLGVLQAGALVYSDDALTLVISRIPDDKMARLMRAALTNSEVEGAGLSIVSRLPRELQERVLGLVDSQTADEALPRLRGRIATGAIGADLIEIAQNVVERLERDRSDRLER
jgi:hypothetical protein